MKTTKIRGYKAEKSVQAAQKLSRTQTKSQRAVSGASQPVMTKVEPAVVDVQFFKDKWNELVKFFREK